MQTYFQNSETVTKLNNFISAIKVSSSGDSNRRQNLVLIDVLAICLDNAKTFDDNCQFSIRKFSPLLKDFDYSNSLALEHGTQLYLAVFYLFICEFDMSTAGDLSLELRSFMELVEEASPVFSPQPKALVEYARSRLVVGILKSLISDERVDSLRKIPPLIDGMHVKIKGWHNELKNSTTTVKNLQQTLERQGDAFNFVGLFKGFDQLSKTKFWELVRARVMMTFLGFAIFAPIGLDFSLLFTHQKEVLAASPVLIAAFAAATFSTTFILIYFYRIVLKSAEACKAQILHIEFRKTLCQFIQRYVKYASDLKENKELLQKFESVIFAPIPYNEDKALSLFDGMDQVSNIVKAFRGSN